MDKQELIGKYSSNLPDSKYRAHYLSYARGFLDYADSMDKETVNKYISKLRRQKRSPGTMNFAFRVVRRLFVVNGLEWPFRRGEAPQITQRDEHKPALDPELIKTMIGAAMDGKLDAEEACFLALSTTYGLRREEMVDLKAPDVDLPSRTVFVSTIKHGRQRYHLIPDEIEPYLAGHDFDREYSLVKMSQMFWRIVKGSELGALRSNRLGWHSIRRTLFTELIEAGLNPLAARDFLRWKGTTGELAMPARYYGNVIVGLNGSKAVTTEAKEDEEIFLGKHPFVPLWR